MSLALFSERVLIDGQLVPASLLIRNGKISQIKAGLFQFKEVELIHCGSNVVFPGLIDSHVHINEPGRTDWEGFDTVTKSAAAGGITTLVDMPLNSSPVTTNIDAFNKKLQAAEGKAHVNVGFWGGIIPGNNKDLIALIEGGVLGIKAFTTHSGIDEFPNVTREDLAEGMPIITKYGLPLLVHAELDQPHANEALLKENPFSYQAWLASRPKLWENNAIKMMIDLCRETGCRTHIVHLSSDEGIPLLNEAIQEGLPMSVECCPQYLFFCAENIPDGDTRFKCAPPIREAANNERLWDAIRSGLISMIVTDHSPAPPNIKEIDTGNIAKAWGGISCLELSLPIVWTKAKDKGFAIEEMAGLMSTNIAAFCNLNSKGEIKEGACADLMVWAPEETFTVQQEAMHFRHKITPYDGQKLYGKIKQTIVNGQLVFDQGSFVSLGEGKKILNAFRSSNC